MSCDANPAFIHEDLTTGKLARALLSDGTFVLMASLFLLCLMLVVLKPPGKRKCAPPLSRRGTLRRNVSLPSMVNCDEMSCGLLPRSSSLDDGASSDEEDDQRGQAPRRGAQDGRPTATAFDRIAMANTREAPQNTERRHGAAATMPQPAAPRSRSSARPGHIASAAPAASSASAAPTARLSFGHSAPALLEASRTRSYERNTERRHGAAATMPQPAAPRSRSSARPGHIASAAPAASSASAAPTARLSFGHSAPALLEASRTRSYERMMTNTCEAPPTPGIPPRRGVGDPPRKRKTSKMERELSSSSKFYADVVSRQRLHGQDF